MSKLKLYTDQELRDELQRRYDSTEWGKWHKERDEAIFRVLQDFTAAADAKWNKSYPKGIKWTTKK